MSKLTSQQLKTQLEQIANAVCSKLETKHSSFSLISDSESSKAISVQNGDNTKKSNLVPAIGGVVIGGGVYITTKNHMYAIGGAVLAASIAHFLTNKKANNQIATDQINKLTFNYAKSKAAAIQLVLYTNEGLINDWHNQLNNLKTDLQNTINVSQNEQQIKDVNLDYTYVFLPLVLDVREWLEKIENIEENENFEAALNSVLQQWKIKTLQQIEETTKEQWNDKYSKIIL